MGQDITCISVGSYDGALTRGQQYELLGQNEQKQHVKVQGDNGRARWFPAGNFDLSGGAVSVIVDWRFDDLIIRPRRRNSLFPQRANQTRFSARFRPAFPMGFSVCARLFVKERMRSWA